MRLKNKLRSSRGSLAIVALILLVVGVCYPGSGGEGANVNAKNVIITMKLTALVTTVCDNKTTIEIHGPMEAEFELEKRGDGPGPGMPGPADSSSHGSANGPTILGLFDLDGSYTSSDLLEENTIGINFDDGGSLDVTLGDDGTGSLAIDMPAIPGIGSFATDLDGVVFHAENNSTGVFSGSGDSPGAQKEGCTTTVQYTVVISVENRG